MKQTLAKLRFLLKNIGQEDIIKKPATLAEIFEREKEYHSPMPEEIKKFLMNSIKRSKILCRELRRKSVYGEKWMETA